jgi:hypothetical protein
MIGCQSLLCPDKYSNLLEHELESLLRKEYIEGLVAVLPLNGYDTQYGCRIIVKSTSTIFISTRPAIFFTGSEETGNPINMRGEQVLQLKALKWRP